MNAALLESSCLVVEHLGHGVRYDDGMGAMRERMAEVEAHPDGPGYLLLLEHAPVITVTRSGGTAHLLAGVEELALEGFDVVETDRGGDVTFHGPGQLVGYPVVKLKKRGAGYDLQGYVRALEQGLVDACRALGVPGASRREGMTGVWAGDEKLVAIGVGVKRAVTRHGFALNVDIDLARYTSRVVPCGLVGRGVTSLARVLGAARPDDERLSTVVATSLAGAFGVALSPAGSRNGFAFEGALHG